MAMREGDAAAPRILLIRTGGTIDAQPYDDARDPPAHITPLPDALSQVSEIVAQLAPGRVNALSWGHWDAQRFVKDSKDFSPEDIAALAAVIRADTHSHFLVTHGTDAMAANAHLLQEHLRGSGKSVMLVGSMVPLSMDHHHAGDARASLAFAVSRLEQQGPGVTIVGRDAHTQRLQCFDPAQVRKDRAASLHDLQLTFAPFAAR